MNRNDERELWELVKEFNQQDPPTFKFARHIWLRSHNLNIDPPANVLKVFVKQLKSDDEEWRRPNLRKVEAFEKKMNKEMPMWYFIYQLYEVEKTTLTEAIERYLKKVGYEDEDGKELTFDVVIKRYTRLDKQMKQAEKELG